MSAVQAPPEDAPQLTGEERQGCGQVRVPQDRVLLTLEHVPVSDVLDIQ